MSETNQESKERNSEDIPRNRANELDGKTWLRYSVSVWSDIRKTKEEMALKHPAMFPTALVCRLIECFTNSDASLILDPFSGVGSTLLAAKELGKDAIGLEISPEFVQVAEGRLSQMNLFGEETKIMIHTTDSRELYRYVPPNSVDMVVTSPPYWDILLRKRTADNKDQRDYGDTESDLGKYEIMRNSYLNFVIYLNRYLLR